jgi:hypothetical protein
VRGTARLRDAPSARLQRIRRLPASDPDRLLLEREPDRRLHGGDRAQGEGAVVASERRDDDRSRRHAYGGEGAPGAWARKRGHLDHSGRPRPTTRTRAEVPNGYISCTTGVWSRQCPKPTTCPLAGTFVSVVTAHSPPFRPPETMVRKGSSVRVRQRALPPSAQVVVRASVALRAAKAVTAVLAVRRASAGKLEAESTMRTGPVRSGGAVRNLLRSTIIEVESRSS